MAEIFSSKQKPLEDNFILIRIIDEGCGIPEDRISRLGEPFL